MKIAQDMIPRKDLYEKSRTIRIDVEPAPQQYW